MAKKKSKPKAKKALTGPLLTKYLRKIAADIETMDLDGDIVTKAHALANLVWKYALGWEEEDPDDPNKKISHKPDWRAVDLLFNRIEGKVMTATVEDPGKTLPEKVEELAVAKANSLADATQDE